MNKKEKKSDDLKIRVPLNYYFFLSAEKINKNPDETPSLDIIPSSANKYGLMQTAMRAKYELPFSKVVRALLLKSPIVCVYAKLKHTHTHWRFE
jgi:hypothetical protein